MGGICEVMMNTVAANIAAKVSLIGVVYLGDLFVIYSSLPIYAV